MLLIPCANSSGQTADLSHKVHKGAVASGISETADAPAKEGVRLLEEIFRKLRNAPQIALAKSKELLAFQAQANHSSSSAARAPWTASDDYLLIKPKAVSDRNNGNDLAISAENSARLAWDKAAPQNALTSQSQPEDELDSVPAPAGSAGKVVSNYDGTPEQLGQVLSNSPLIKEFKKSPASAAKSNSAGSNPDNVGIAQPTLNLSDALQRAKSPAFRQLAKSLSGANLQKLAQLPVQINQVSQSATDAKSASFTKLAAGTTKIPATDGHARIIKIRSGFEPNVYKANIYKKEERLPEVAFLPLTKFSGIPLVSLGDSELEVAHRFLNLGKVEKTVVKPWTVLSLTRPNSKDYSLQVFLQNSLVEAFRVRDGSLWPGEQGIRVGDEIAVVKEKFGEPAFIISHPLNGPNKLYVYPIGQVAFQLERSSNNEIPRIRGVFIFSAK